MTDSMSMCRLCPSLNCPHPANIVTLYVNLSLWAWSAFLVVVFATCTVGKQIILL